MNHPNASTGKPSGHEHQRQALIKAMELDAMPAPGDQTTAIPDCTWNTDQLSALLTWVLEQAVAHGVHPTNIIPNQSEWPPVPWQPTTERTPTTMAASRGYYWGRNRGGRHIGIDVTPGPGIDGHPSIRLAPIAAKTQEPTGACEIELTAPMATKLIDNLATQISTARAAASDTNDD